MASDFAHAKEERNQMTISYDSRITPELVLSLAKVGMVSVTSSQIVISGEREISLRGVEIPPCLEIEWIGHVDGLVQLTLRLKKEIK